MAALGPRGIIHYSCTLKYSLTRPLSLHSRARAASLWQSYTVGNKHHQCPSNNSLTHSPNHTHTPAPTTTNSRQYGGDNANILCCATKGDAGLMHKYWINAAITREKDKTLLQGWEGFMLDDDGNVNQTNVALRISKDNIPSSWWSDT